MGDPMAGSEMKTVSQMTDAEMVRYLDSDVSLGTSGAGTAAYGMNGLAQRLADGRADPTGKDGADARYIRERTDSRFDALRAMGNECLFGPNGQRIR